MALWACCAVTVEPSVTAARSRNYMRGMVGEPSGRDIETHNLRNLDPTARWRVGRDVSLTVGLTERVSECPTPVCPAVMLVRISAFAERRVLLFALPCVAVGCGLE